MKPSVTVEEWVARFKAIGLDQAVHRHHSGHCRNQGTRFAPTEFV